jgi:hypothetical protein
MQNRAETYLAHRTYQVAETLTLYAVDLDSIWTSQRAKRRCISPDRTPNAGLAKDVYSVSRGQWDL